MTLSAVLVCIAAAVMLVRLGAMLDDFHRVMGECREATERANAAANAATLASPIGPRRCGPREVIPLHRQN